MVIRFWSFYFLLYASLPQTRLKATLGKGLQEENIKDENNSGELKVGIDIPLKTV